MRTKGLRNSQESNQAERPALTPEQRENQMIALSMDLVEQRLRDGTASSSETVHFLRLASSKEKLEREKDKEEIKLLRARTESLESMGRIEALYSEAINAMKTYGGQNGYNQNL